MEGVANVVTVVAPPFQKATEEVKRENNLRPVIPQAKEGQNSNAGSEVADQRGSTSGTNSHLYAESDALIQETGEREAKKQAKKKKAKKKPRHPPEEDFLNFDDEDENGEAEGGEELPTAPAKPLYAAGPGKGGKPLARTDDRTLIKAGVKNFRAGHAIARRYNSSCNSAPVGDKVNLDI